MNSPGLLSSNVGVPILRYWLAINFNQFKKKMALSFMGKY
jgi:hypothetical protein